MTGRLRPQHTIDCL